MKQEVVKIDGKYYLTNSTDLSDAYKALDKLEAFIRRTPKNQKGYNDTRKALTKTLMLSIVVIKKHGEELKCNPKIDTFPYQ